MVRFAYLAVLLLAVTIAAEQIRFDGHKVLRVEPRTQEQLDILKTFLDQHELHLDIWKGPRSVDRPVDVHVDAKANTLVSAFLRRHGFTYRTMIADLKQLVDEERRQMAARKLKHGGQRALDITTYNRHSAIMDWVDGTAASCDYCEVYNAGKSHEGRDLKVIKVGRPGSNKKAIFIDGGIHAREWISPATVIWIVDSLITNYNNGDATARLLVDSFDWYFMPVMNPDGYEWSHTNYRMWRKTRKANSNPSCPGTDANRNWDHHWNEVGASNNPCSDVYAGSRAFSEVETTATANFISARSASLVGYINVHSYGQYWMTPWGYTSALPPDYNDLVGVARKAVNALTAVNNRGYTIGSSTNVLYAAAGGADDWAKGEAGVKYSYCLELPDTGYYGFGLPPSYIPSVGKETYAGVMAMGTALYDIYRPN